jgi:hypothetical protein
MIDLYAIHPDFPGLADAELINEWLSKLESLGPG